MIIDLTMPIDERTPTFPGDTKQDIRVVATVERDGWCVRRLTMSSHFSTHIDAPSHMIEGGRTLSDYPIGKFMGEGIVLDVTGMDEIEVDLSRVRENDIVLFLTGHGRKANDDDYFENNPVITERTARELVRRKVGIVGLDSFTPDNEPYRVHRIFLENDILIVENLVNLDRLAGRRFRCCILPLNIRNADGAPCRVVGIIE